MPFGNSTTVFGLKPGRSANSSTPGPPGAAVALGWGTAGNRSSGSCVQQAQLRSCAGLGPASAVSRLSREGAALATFAAAACFQAMSRDREFPRRIRQRRKALSTASASVRLNATLCAERLPSLRKRWCSQVTYSDGMRHPQVTSADLAYSGRHIIANKITCRTGKLFASLVSGASIMNPIKVFVAAFVTAALVGFAPPAFAQRHGGGGGGHNRGGSGNQRGGGGGGAARSAEPRGQGSSENRGGAGGRSDSGNRAESGDRGAANRGAVENRGQANRSEPRAVAPRVAGSPRAAVSRGVSPRAYSSVRGGYYGYNGGVRYSRIAPVRFYRPYYAFRPRVSLGFGLWVGYPFAYSVRLLRSVLLPVSL